MKIWIQNSNQEKHINDESNNKDTAETKSLKVGTVIDTNQSPKSRYAHHATATSFLHAHLHGRIHKQANYQTYRKKKIIFESIYPKTNLKKSLCKELQLQLNPTKHLRLLQDCFRDLRRETL